MLDNVRADIARGCSMNGRAGFWGVLAEVGYPGTTAVLVYRFGHWLRGFRIPLLRQLLQVCYFVLKRYVRTVIGVTIPSAARIGPGMVVHTWSGVYVPGCRIGRNLFVQHGVVITHDCLEIGDDVYFGAGAKVVKKVRIGSNVRIGANAVVVADVPDWATVVGIPGRIVERSRT